MLTAVVLLTALPTYRLSAQVGHEPSRSPFHDITTTQGLTIMFGRFAGARAHAPVGAKPGAFAAFRIETRLSGPIDLFATFGRAWSSRNVVDPADTAAGYVTGEVDQRLTTGDLAVILNVTGAKRWHALAPYVGVGFGLMNASPNTSDPGGFRVGSNFIMVPTLGTRAFLGRSLALRFEVRDYWLRYEWPLAYYAPADSSGGPVAPLLSADTKTRQVTHNFVLTAGLTYQFTF